MKAKGIHYLDVGTSGGVWGLDRGYCLMIGGDKAAVEAPRPDLQGHRPGHSGANDRPRGQGRRRQRQARPANAKTAKGTAVDSYLHCGPSGAGHFVKMVHNGIEYGIMAAYAEGLNILKHANVGKQGRDRRQRRGDAAAQPDHYQYDFDLQAVCENWRRGSVIASWLLDLTAEAFLENPELPIERSTAQAGTAYPTPARAAGRCWPPSTRACPARC